MGKPMNRHKKFMTFLEGMVTDTNLLKTIRQGYHACTESISHEGGTEWMFDVEELEYPLEIAKAYFDLKKEIHDYKEETGIEKIDANDVVVSAVFYVDFDFDYIPHVAASMQGPEEGGVEFDGNEITSVELTLYIDGDERSSVDLDDEQLEDMNASLSAALEKEIDKHSDTIAEKEEERAAEAAADAEAEAAYEREMDRDYDYY